MIRSIVYKKILTKNLTQIFNLFFYSSPQTCSENVDIRFDNPRVHLREVFWTKLKCKLKIKIKLIYFLI